MSYRKILNGIAHKVLKKRIAIPDYHLMVGTAEQLAPQTLRIPQQKIMKGVADNLKNLETLSNEEITASIQNNTLEINDFNGNTSLIADMIGGAVK